jgi:CubicO group peptidase (beta-lactamase class C family)
MKDWNAPGIGVGIVVKDKLVFAKGYGFRDYGKKLRTPRRRRSRSPRTRSSFTAVALGLLVEEGKLRWDEPIKRFVPAIRFYNDELDRSVTIRDMLSHRTGCHAPRRHLVQVHILATRPLGSPALPRPAARIRTTFLYNNLMYTAAGQAIEN